MHHWSVLLIAYVPLWSKINVEALGGGGAGE